MSIKLVIDNSLAPELAALAHHPKEQFIRGAIRAAQNSHGSVKAGLIKEICGLLDCRESDLDFLFKPSFAMNEAMQNDCEIPDFRSTLDGRGVKLKDAAE